VETRWLHFRAFSRPQQFVPIDARYVSKGRFERRVLDGFEDERSQIRQAIVAVGLQLGQFDEAANEGRFGTWLPQVLAPSRVVDSTSGLGPERLDLLDREPELLSDLFGVDLLVGVKREDDSM
jgi:hypothetical protein